MIFNENFIPELGRSQRMAAEVKQITGEIARVARSNAPEDTSEYVSSIREELIMTPYRVVGKVVADCDHAMLVESRNGTLARALGSVSGRG